VRIGNFVNRGDAENFKKELMIYLQSQPRYVIEDLIEYIPKADEFHDEIFMVPERLKQ